jgi:hypothetical protein
MGVGTDLLTPIQHTNCSDHIPIIFGERIPAALHLRERVQKELCFGEMSFWLGGGYFLMGFTNFRNHATLDHTGTPYSCHDSMMGFVMEFYTSFYLRAKL